MVLRLKSYSEALDYLFARTTGVTKLGLERTEAILEALGNPHDALVSFHIAGTNGKGSVAAILERFLQRMGLRVGKYTSPHLVDFRERIVIDGRTIDESFITSFVDRWTPLVEKTGATFFEATTAMAFDAFARADVDVAIIETGLGGRLDSTNVVSPRVAIVTGVGLDHAEFLGTTIPEIAAEKAGIFKRGVPAVIGERSPEVRSILAQKAQSAGASRVHLVAEETSIEGAVVGDTTTFRLTLRGKSHDMMLGLRGAHQMWNTSTAISALFAAGDRFRPATDLIPSALADLSLPGRCQLEGNLVLDVAHNPDGAAVLRRCLSDLFPGERFTVLLCVLADKDWRGIIEQLSNIAAHFILSDAPGAPATRRWDLEQVRKSLEATALDFEVIADFDRALQVATSASGRVLITGSFHTVGDAMSRLQLSPLPR